MVQVIAIWNLDFQHQVIANAQKVVMIQLLDDEHDVLSCSIFQFVTYSTTKDPGSLPTTWGDLNIKGNFLCFSGNESSR